ncbi:hypothetical protein [Desulfonatronum lacustre]|uniref:hypothetical protein n=1 Tax=Desulfonatronum lacustre TaxID=66849 RepID=UPI00048D51C2|nr:hypothetical protein [Desulfonatronum lacustre]SMP66876.1 hypothetical protein SAMN06295888_11479 [Desulfonatronum zhilinae]
MKSRILIGSLLIAVSFAFFGCDRFTGGAATGAAVGVLGAGAAYEYQNKRQMDQLELDYSEGRINEQEYNIRKEQIQRGSIIY